MVEYASLVSDSEMRTAAALDTGEKTLDGLSDQLAQNSVEGGDPIAVTMGTKSMEFNADSAAAGFLVGQIAQRIQQGLTTAVAPAVAKDGIAKMVSQKT